MATLLCDEEGRAQEVNQAWVDLTGLNRRSSRRQGWQRVLLPEDRQAVLELIRGAASAGGPTATDFRAEVRGERRWTRWWMQSLGQPECHVGLAVADVDDDHLLLDQLRHRASHDPLTGLSVRTHLFDLLLHAQRARRRHPSHLALLYLDLDAFKDVNDSYGHAAGDQVLAAAAGALQRAVRPDDVVARVGGDEFAIMCDHLDDVEDVAVIVERLEEALATPVLVAGASVRMTASIGVAFAGDADESPEELLDRADRAMYRSKRGTRAPGARPRRRHH